MDLCNINDIKALLARHGFHFSKSMGQNFLIDKNALDAILDAAEIESGVRCLEIGPGLGVLTEGLLSRGCAVTAIEKDPVLADRLKGALGNPEGLTVLAGDALDFIKRGACDGFPLMVSNLPYQAGTRILIELAERVCPCAPSVERELDPPVQCAAVEYNRPPANESMPKWPNAIGDATTNCQLPTTNYQLPTAWTSML